MPNADAIRSKPERNLPVDVRVRSMSLPLDAKALAQDFVTLGSKSGWEVQHLSPIRDCPRPWLRLPGSDPEAPRLYLSSGVHGDEPAPPLALLELIQHPGAFTGLEVLVFPLINPEGLNADARENRFGVDCNRDYLALQSEEVRGHVEVLKQLPPLELALYLHEDWEAKGAYLYELNPHQQSSYSAPLLDALRHHLPIETASEIDGFPADHGLISRIPAEVLERQDWPESLYVAKHLCPINYTVETPSALPLRHRVAAQVEAVKTAARALADLPATHS